MVIVTERIDQLLTKRLEDLTDTVLVESKTEASNATETLKTEGESAPKLVPSSRIFICLVIVNIKLHKASLSFRLLCNGSLYKKFTFFFVVVDSKIDIVSQSLLLSSVGVSSLNAPAVPDSPSVDSTSITDLEKELTITTQAIEDMEAIRSITFESSGAIVKPSDSNSQRSDSTVSAVSGDGRLGYSSIR